MNSKIKKVVIFAGLVLVCIGSLSLALSRANAAEPTAPASSSTSSEEINLGSPDSITVPPISSSPSSDTGSAFVPSSGAVSSKPLTVVSKPASQPPKPTPPPSSALTNKAKKPSYTTPPKAPSSKSPSNAPSGGKPGQIYVPGFGWQTPSPKGHMTTVTGDWGGGKQIGSMD